MLELADIVRRAGAAFRATHALSDEQLRALRDIEECRTAARGGQLTHCDHCSAERYVYHSCRNRHCPKCHGEQTARWLEAHAARFPACPYFLFTFTLPRELHAVTRAHPRRVFGLLMRCAAQSLLALCADPRYLGGRPGLLAVLHTWTRALLFHPHVHVLITAGGLDADDQAWRLPRHHRFLVPAYALSVLFRGKFRAALKRAGLLQHTPSVAWAKPWVVHGQHAGDGAGVLRYLARYVFRVALPNSRLVALADDRVSFRYVDRRTGAERLCTLSAADFLTRFVQHVLPDHFVKVRHYGLFSPSAKRHLEHVCDLLQVQEKPTTAPSPLPDPNPLCPICRLGHLRVVQILPRMLRGP